MSPKPRTRALTFSTASMSKAMSLPASPRIPATGLSVSKWGGHTTPLWQGRITAVILVHCLGWGKSPQTGKSPALIRFGKMIGPTVAVILAAVLHPDAGVALAQGPVGSSRLCNRPVGQPDYGGPILYRGGHHCRLIRCRLPHPAARARSSAGRSIQCQDATAQISVIGRANAILSAGPIGPHSQIARP